MACWSRFGVRSAFVFFTVGAAGCGADDSRLFVSDPGAAGEGNGAASTAPAAPEGRPASAAAPPMQAAADPTAEPGPPRSDEGNPGSAPLSPPEDVEAADLPVPDDGEQTWVFDPAAVHTYELSLDPERWAALQRDALDEQYTEADLVAAGRALGRVGLRFKGNLGTLVSCFAEDGTRRCDKLSMKLKFDEYEPEQRFFGLKRLNFNSMLYDGALMRERIAYRVYREMGVVAPRAAHARLVINGEDQGVFTLVEDVDGRFTDQHFDGGDGNLYKEAWPGNLDDAVLARALTTNEDVADHSALLEFQADLRAAAADEIPSVLSRYLDVDTTLAYLAVDQTIINWDGIGAFFCYDESCENHNYYWYQDDTEQRFTLVPWDLDNTFSSSPLEGVPGLFDEQADCSLSFEAAGRRVRAPACDPLLRGLIDDRASYGAQLQRLIEGPFAPGVIESWIDEIEVLLAPEVMTDSRGPDLATFRTDVERLRASVARLREQAEVERERHR
jgi:hypothetical protein